VVVVVAEAVVGVAEEEVVVAEVVAVVAEVVAVAEPEAPVVVVVLRRNNADPNRCRQCLADRLYPNQRPKSEELWSSHRSHSNECGQYLQTTNQQR
jgi:hypothetical protein